MTCLIEKKMYGVSIEFERQGFEKRYIIRHYFFITEVKLMSYYRVYVIVTQQEICNVN